MYYKQSAFVVSMLLGANAVSHSSRDAPRSVSYFAEGVSPDEELSVKVETGDDLEPEKVSVLETTKAGSHTTFYGQSGQAPAQAAHLQLAGDVYPEKVHITDEEYYRHRADPLKKPTYPYDFPEGMERTAFYSQIADDATLGADPEKVSVLETTKAGSHTTFYPQKEQRPAHQRNIQSQDDLLGDLPEKVSVLETTKGANLRTFYAQKDATVAHKVEPVGPSNIDPWVEEFSNENMQGIANSHVQQPVAVHFAQKTDRKRFEGETSHNEEQNGYSYNGYAGWGDLGKESYDSPAYKASSGFNVSAPANASSFAQVKTKDVNWGNTYYNEEKSGYAPNGSGANGWGDIAKNSYNSSGYFSDSKYNITAAQRAQHAQQKSQSMTPSGHKLVQKSKRDISEENINESVHDFTNPLVDRETFPRTCIVPESSSNFVQKNKKDISEHGIEPNVHAFASDQVDVLKWPRVDEQYDNNGTGPKGWGDLGKNEFNSSGYYSNSGINATYGNYSSGNASIAQIYKKDISENGIDENVHAFANPLVDVMNKVKKDTPYQPNGTGPKGWGDLGPHEFNSSGYYVNSGINATYGNYSSGNASIAQIYKKDISENGIDENVHAFANPLVDVFNKIKKDTPYQPNGTGPKGWGDLGPHEFNSSGYYVNSGINATYGNYSSGNASIAQVQTFGMHPRGVFAQKDNKDIKNSNIRVDVYNVVNDIVDPSSDAKTDKVPVSTYEPYNGEPLYKAPCKPGIPVVEDAMVTDDGVQPEKVHVLEPEAYQERANTNTPNQRTTFYDKQNRLWKYNEKKGL